MGCCLSSTRKPVPNPKLKTHTQTRSAIPPPQPEEEEETIVKEVLSETPKPKPVNPVHNPTRLLQHPKPISHINKRTPPPPSQPVPEIADVSEASEISVSTIHDDEFSGEVRRMVARSPMKMRTRNYSGEMRERGVTGRNPGPSPGRVRSKERIPVVVTKRRDSGEISGRRSKSPAARLNQSPSVRKMGRAGSDNMTRMDPTRKIEEKEVGKRVAPTVGDESLENPLVSLECFIFL